MCSDAMRLEPNSPDVLTIRGLVMFLTAKTAQALQHAQSALRLDPGHEPALHLRKRVKDVDRLKDEGNAAFKAGRLEEATRKYGEALEVRAQVESAFNYVTRNLIRLTLMLFRGSETRRTKARAGIWDWIRGEDGWLRLGESAGKPDEEKARARVGGETSVTRSSRVCDRPGSTPPVLQSSFVRIAFTGPGRQG